MLIPFLMEYPHIVQQDRWSTYKGCFTNETFGQLDGQTMKFAISIVIVSHVSCVLCVVCV